MNKILLTGGPIRDAELSFLTTGTAKMTFILAVERSYQKDKNNKKVDFINCEMLGKGAEALVQYITKGKQILVEGELNIDQYEKDGERRSFTKVKIDRLEFQKGNAAADKKEATEELGFQIVEDGDIPF